MLICFALSSLFSTSISHCWLFYCILSFTSFVLHITNWFTFIKDIFSFWVGFELKLEDTYSIRNFPIFVDWVLPFLSYDKVISIKPITRVKGFNNAAITSIIAWSLILVSCRIQTSTLYLFVSLTSSSFLW